MGYIEPQVVLITGASSGIGLEAARALAGRGHTVYAGARRADRIRDELGPHGVIPLQLDVTDSEQCATAVRTVMEDCGRLDALINNAGFGLFGPVEEVPLGEARRQFAVNLFGTADMTQRVLPHMRNQGGGRIINTSSIVSHFNSPYGAWYHASKSALDGWSNCLRVEVAPFNIRVVLMQPGAIRTEFADGPAEALAQIGARSEPYRQWLAGYVNTIAEQKTWENASSPEELASVYVTAVEAKRPRRRYLSGRGAWTLTGARRVLGEPGYDAALGWILRRGYRRAAP